MVVLRFTTVGRRGERRFRLVVKERRSKRDGQAIESLGWYEKTEKGIAKQIDLDRVKYWISQGAIPSQTVKEVLGL